MKKQIFFFLALFVSHCLDSSSGGLAKASWTGAGLGWTNWVNKTAPTDTNTDLQTRQLIPSFNAYVGLPVAIAAGRINRGFRWKAAKNPGWTSSIAQFYGSTTGQTNFFLTSEWIGQFATLLSTGSPPYQQMRYFNKGALSQVEQGYVTNHLVPALNEINTATKSEVDPVGHTTNINFTGGSWSGAIIDEVYNNTKETFTIEQGGNPIGTLAPGSNTVALYGAAQGQGDIVFRPSSNQLASCRVTFKNGPDVITVANSGLSKNDQISSDNPPLAASKDSEFLCVQITKEDFPAGTDSEVIDMMQRTQCINLSQLNDPSRITLKIDDNMTILNNGKQVALTQKEIPCFYPSIVSITPLPGQYPFLTVPPSLQKNSTIQCWVWFLNILTGCLGSNYKTYNEPNVVTDYLTYPTLAQYFLVKQDGEYFGDLTKTKKVTYQGGPTGAYFYTAPSGLAGTQYAFTADIPSQQTYDYYFKINAPIANLGALAASAAQSGTMTDVQILAFAKDNSTYVPNYWQKLIKQYDLSVRLVETQKDGSMSFEVIGSANFAQNMSKMFAQKPLLAEVLQQVDSIAMQSSLGQGTSAEYSIDFAPADIIANIQAQVSDSKHKSYLTLSAGIWSILIPKYLWMVYGQKNTNPTQYKVDFKNIDKIAQDKKIMQLLLAVKKVGFIDQVYKKLVHFKSLDVLQATLSKYNLTVNAQGDVITLPAKPDKQLAIGQAVEELWLSPTFSNNKTADFSLDSTSSDYIKSINKVLSQPSGGAVDIKLVAKPNSSKTALNATVIATQSAAFSASFSKTINKPVTKSVNFGVSPSNKKNSQLWLGFMVDNTFYTVADNTEINKDAVGAKYPGVAYKTLTSLTSVLNKAPLSDWQNGVYFVPAVHKNQLYMFVYNAEKEQIATALVGPVSSKNPVIAWWGSYIIQAPINISNLGVFGVALNADITKLSPTFSAVVATGSQQGVVLVDQGLSSLSITPTGSRKKNILTKSLRDAVADLGPQEYVTITFTKGAKGIEFQASTSAGKIGSPASLPASQDGNYIVSYQSSAAKSSVETMTVGQDGFKLGLQGISYIPGELFTHTFENIQNPTDVPVSPKATLKSLGVTIKTSDVKQPQELTSSSPDSFSIASIRSYATAIPAAQKQKKSDAKDKQSAKKKKAKSQNKSSVSQN